MVFQPIPGVRGLEDEHRRELMEGSAISEEIINGRGYFSVSRLSNADESNKRWMKENRFPSWSWDENRLFPGYVIPMYDPLGKRVAAQWKPRVAVADYRRGGKKMKYASQKGLPNRLDVHPKWKDAILDPKQTLWITEGVKKADSLSTKDQVTIAIAGVYSWRESNRTVADFENVMLRGRKIILCFDSDAWDKPNVLRAMIRLGSWLKNQGVESVRYLIVPTSWDGKPTKGIDDFFAAGGTIPDLKPFVKSETPNPDRTNDSFTDARLAEVVAEEVFGNRFMWVAGLGWMKWTGTHWTAATEVTVREAVRRYSLDRHTSASLSMKEDGADSRQVDGWRQMLSASKERTVMDLAKGLVERHADELDSDPDVFNTPSGTVDLETGEVRDHDPNDLITKISGIGFVPGAEHPLWKKALEAFSTDEVADWYQMRIGQAITGHMPPDDLMVIAQGGGSNGKTTIAATIATCAGEYHRLLSDRVLMADPSQHPTELMDLLGCRYAVLEETPEARRLDAQRLKRTVGTPTITARRIRQDDVTFRSTHSLFINTNHRPVLEDSDEGVWRRVALVVFPWTFHIPGRMPERPGPWDRPGDPGLREACLSDPGVQEAALAWMVEGARRWYAADKSAPRPERVNADTDKWRSENDLAYAFMTEQLVFDAGQHVMSTDLLAELNAWLKARGHLPWNIKTMTSRLGEHAVMRARNVERRDRVRLNDRLSRPDSATSYVPGTDSAVVVVRAAGSAPPKQYGAWMGIRFRGERDDESEPS